MSAGVSVVVGAQYGSEGKGKTVSLLSRDHGERCVTVRCGGPNSGHTIHAFEKKFVFRQLPSGLVYGRLGFIAAGAVVDLGILQQEIEEYQVKPGSLVIDPYAVVIDPSAKKLEKVLVEGIASTGSGTGYATACKVIRDAELVKDWAEEKRFSWLKHYLGDVSVMLNCLQYRGHRIILEGAQGFGLSLHHSRMYPKVTSRDTTAAQFVMEAGLSPLLVDEIILVVRTFPIRVAGKQAGPLKNETTWEVVKQLSGYPYDITEWTTVTGKVRRVAHFDMDLVAEACLINRPTTLAVHGLDYLNFLDKGICTYSDLSRQSKDFLSSLERRTKTPVKYAFTGPGNDEVISFI
jgi:adenylosuccinate synthase